jgi:Zn-finger nucleic acid-binding protein
MMDCPGCESELRRRRLKNGVVIDSCPDCKGTWLDRGELSRFTRKKRHAQESADELTWDSTYSDRNCCRCGEQMFSGEFAESDIEVDYCRSCEGLWFDARELKKAI